ncbi:radical SAM protein [Solidesulfovibrio sp.]
MNNITFIIKTTLRCNLSCQYCYEGHNSHRTDIQEDTARLLITKIANHFTQKKTTTTLIWHGGEPLLRGIDFFNSIINTQKLQTHIDFKNLIQTNGLLLDETFAEFLTNNGFNVGISLDGPKHLHDAQRQSTTGKSSYESASKAIDTLANSGNKVRALAVFTKNTLANIDDFYSFFRSRQLDFKINPLLNIGSATDSEADKIHITSKEYGDALIYLFNKWINEPKHTFTIDPFDNILRSLVTGKSRCCSFSGQCSNYFKVAPDGTIRPCGKKDDDTYLLGNIETDSIAQILSSKNRNSFQRHRASVRDNCVDCEHFDICNGGCTTASSIRRGNISDKDYYCESYKSLFSHIKNTVKELSCQHGQKTITL